MPPVDTDPIMIAAEAAFEIERLQIMAQGKRLPQDNTNRNIFNMGFSAGALWCVRELAPRARNSRRQSMDPHHPHRWPHVCLCAAFPWPHHRAAASSCNDTTRAPSAALRKKTLDWLFSVLRSQNAAAGGALFNLDKREPDEPGM